MLMTWTEQMWVTDNVPGQSHYFIDRCAAGKLLWKLAMRQNYLVT